MLTPATTKTLKKSSGSYRRDLRLGDLVDKHLGDGLMGVFGRTFSGGDRAVEAVERIVEAYPNFRQRLSTEEADNFGSQSG